MFKQPIEKMPIKRSVSSQDIKKPVRRVLAKKPDLIIPVIIKHNPDQNGADYEIGIPQGLSPSDVDPEEISDFLLDCLNDYFNPAEEEEVCELDEEDYEVEPEPMPSRKPRATARR